jgi:CheY-like chemotaxis protein
MKKQKIKLLAVEDDEIARVALSALLADRLGHSVDFADNGALALKLFNKKTYDLIIMDIALVDMDGFTITNHFRAIEKQKKMQPTPIVALSAYDDDSFKKCAFSAGVDEYIVKPLTLKAFQHLLDNLVLQKKAK